MIGLKRGTVVLCNHEKQWETEAQNTIMRLKKILGPVIRDIQHVGSTAIKTIKAKPIIDIAIAVDCFDDVLVYKKQLEAAGFYYRPNSDLGEQLLFASGSLYDGTGDLQTHFIHIVMSGSMDWINYINFRDYLNKNPDIAKQYEDLKVSLVAEAPIDNGREKYLKGKHDFIVYTLRKALVKSYLGKTVDMKIDRPIGYVHQKENYSLTYPINYGYIEGVLGGDGEELDVYLLGVDKPVSEYRAKVIGIVHRENDVEDKLIAAPESIIFNQAEIAEAIHFQEKYYKTYVEAIYQKSCGVVVFRTQDEKREYLCLLQNLSGSYSVPKGHIEAYESEKDCALRELFEETGIKTELIDGFKAEINYKFLTRSGEKQKTVVLFLAEYNGALNIDHNEIISFQWLDTEKAKQTLPNGCSKVINDAEKFLL
ncbi:MAG: GrpB family protein [Clostridia bacterium]|nr:GrpB family protein [Clostridia bacterium]